MIAFIPASQYLVEAPLAAITALTRRVNTAQALLCCTRSAKKQATLKPCHKFLIRKKPAAENHPHSMTLPPPLFTVGTVCFCQCAVFDLHQTQALLADYPAAGLPDRCV